MKRYKIGMLAVMAAAAFMIGGCSKGSDKPVESTAPSVPLVTLVDDVMLPDRNGAEIELLSLDDPTELSYSSGNTDMLFKKKDGAWMDAMDSQIPLNQEKLEAMADNFLHLQAVSKVDAHADLADYGLEYPSCSLIIMDRKKGETTVLIGEKDGNGNYYATLDERNYYTLKPQTVEALIFDYEKLVIRDSLDVTVSADDIQKASVTVRGKTTAYSSSDKEVMARIAEGICNLKPSEYSTFHASEQELYAAEISESDRTTFTAEIKNNGEVQALTVYVGTYADAESKTSYVQLDGSKMLAIVDSAIVDNLLNRQQEE